VQKIPPLLQLWAAALCLLLPFVGKAFHIDDPLFLWTAQHIVHHPTDPFGFSVSWFDSVQTMPDAFKNPPLAAYYAAAIGSLFGFGEVPMHLAFLLPALALLWGTYRLAEHFGTRPLLCGVLVLISPAFLVSAMTVMCDVTMVAFLVWSAVWWLRALSSNRIRDYLCAGLLLSLAFLTKYTAVLFLPLFLGHGFIRRPGGARWLVAAALPAATISAYEYWTSVQYGRGLFLDAMHYSSQVRNGAHVSLPSALLESLCFCGGCTLPCCLLYGRKHWRRLWIAVVPVAALIAWVALTSTVPKIGSVIEDTSFHWREPNIFVQGFVLTLAGCLLPAWTLQAFRNREKPAADSGSGMSAGPGDLPFLCAWVVAIFLFGSVLNWTQNARSFLPLLPPAAVLVALQLEGAPWAQTRGRFLSLLVPCTALGLLVLLGDFAGANAQRREAETVVSDILPQAPHLRYLGSWGFGYYLHRAGLEAVDITRTRLRPGDLIVVTDNSSSVTALPMNRLKLVVGFKTRVPALASTMDKFAGSGFYSTVWGPLPFSFWPQPGSEDCAGYEVQ